MQRNNKIKNICFIMFWRSRAKNTRLKGSVVEKLQ